MNTLNAEMGDAQLRALSDIELDDVNGGLSWFTKALLIGVAIALALA